MLAKIRSAYKSNPILFVHVAAPCLYIVWTIFIELIVEIVIPQSLSMVFREAAAVIFAWAICLWLAYVTSQRSKAHSMDESRFTYYALKCYSNFIKTILIVWVLSYIIVFIGPIQLNGVIRRQSHALVTQPSPLGEIPLARGFLPKPPATVKNIRHNTSTILTIVFSTLLVVIN